jgi:hypothetical protein
VRDFRRVSGFRVEANFGLSVTTENFEGETMLSSTTRIPLLVAMLVLAACERPDTPTAPTPVAAIPTAAQSNTDGAERWVDERLFDVSGSFFGVECSDGRLSELVELQGQIFERFTVVSNPAGGFHALYHTMPIGLQGIGAESGEEFRVKVQDHGSFGQTTMGLVGTYRQVLEMVGSTSGRSFSLIVRGHYTINANGQIVVEREELAADCE